MHSILCASAFGKKNPKLALDAFLEVYKEMADIRVALAEYYDFLMQTSSIMENLSLITTEDLIVSRLNDPIDRPIRQRVPDYLTPDDYLFTAREKELVITNPRGPIETTPLVYAASGRIERVKKIRKMVSSAGRGPETHDNPILVNDMEVAF